MKETPKKTTKKKPSKAAAKAPKWSSDKELALAAARIARERHCTDITVLDLTGISPATNYFVIATGTSNRQSRTVADEISQEAKKQGHRRFGIAGYEHGQWILLDFVTVVVHIFDAEHRDYYNLEMLWGDAKQLTIDD
ncbi:MAG: ribosome silencing factor [Planctomycetales bacterium]|nr:ribosome silencing factor [Planctomycetales bacterium]